MATPTEELQGKVSASSDELVAALRKAVRPPGQRPSWLSSLNNRQLVEVYHRLQLGNSMLRIVKIAQQEWRIMPTSRPASLCRAVSAFRDKVVGAIQKLETSSEPAVKEMSERMAKEVNRVTGKIDALGKLGWLITVQEERIAMLFTREKASNLPFKHTDNTIKIMGELLGNYVSLQVQLGVVPTVPDELNMNVKHKFDGVLGAVGSDGAKVVDALGKFLNWADQHAVKMVLDEKTGAYVPVHKELPDGNTGTPEDE